MNKNDAVPVIPLCFVNTMTKREESVVRVTEGARLQMQHKPL